VRGEFFDRKEEEEEEEEVFYATEVPCLLYRFNRAAVINTKTTPAPRADDT
jgi:hypothetical protein